ncbi:transcriptional regulator [Actinomadura logoneensis]|uniref:Transcriptional regulator n=1 Tax=Actinomadura logoneensis TaxID=2293572 RepID=A0A372JTH0_9ACTN|nr:ATP-binding protein [Actinomadura logoneensis]RFU43249.1 transcriptional regulator [Actinomadura logoneensis]
MLDGELSEIVDNLRVIGADIADVEVKKALGGLPKSLRETISAFANTAGGIVILGLDEAQGFSATGLIDAAKLAADLGSMCSEDMEPPIRPLVKIHTFEGAQVLVAEIPELDPAQKPCYSRGAGITKGSYIRVGDGDRRLSAYEVQVMLSSRGQPREDEQGVPGVGLDNLDAAGVEALVARLRTSRPYAFKDLDRLAVLRRAKVLVPGDDGKDLVSLAGLLALGDYPQEHFPQLRVSFVHYPTGSGPTSSERFLDNVTLEGPIPVMVRDSLAAIRRNMSRRAVIAGAGRQDVWEYPETALREAVVNALVHRDLSPSARGTQVQIEMYPDRLVIRNAGGLFGPVTIDSLGEEGISSARNATLIKILEDVPLPGETRTVCENRGSGIRSMLDSLRAAGMSPPQFTDKISSFLVAFPNHTLLSEETISWIRSLGERGLTDGQCIALALLRDEGVLDNRTYRDATGVDSRVATGELQDLVARELIVQTGTRRWARYQLAQRHTSVKGRPARADRRPELLAALGDESLSRAELVARTGLSDQTVRRWLKIMRDEGAVELVGDSPKSIHVRYRRTRQEPLFGPESPPSPT